MPAGVPVATVAIDGARNAGHLAARILALTDPRSPQRIVATPRRNRRGQPCFERRAATDVGKGRSNPRGVTVCFWITIDGGLVVRVEQMYLP